MKDTELRGIVLQKYYDNRRGNMFTPKPEEFDEQISFENILAISEQLGKHNLITWKAIKSIGGVQVGLGKISAFGIDVIEGAATPDIKVEFVQNKSITISGSSNVIVGDNNKQSVSHHINEVIRAIDSSHATPEQKNEAKSLLSKLLELPIMTHIVDSAITLLNR